MSDSEIYVKINGKEYFDSIEGNDLLAIIKENIKPKRKFLVDLSTIKAVTPDGAHKLQQLLIEANNGFCEVVFTTNDSIDELISSLTLNDES